jgi:hypothetical protein
VRSHSAFPAQGSELATLALFSSTAFDYIFKASLGRFEYPEFIVGVLQTLPWAQPTNEQFQTLQKYAKRAWVIKRILDTTQETSHAFTLPVALRSRLGDYVPHAIETELKHIQSEIDAIAFELYGFSKLEQQAALGLSSMAQSKTVKSNQICVDDNADEISLDNATTNEVAATQTPGDAELLSWAVGVAFGRFDWRLATNERAVPIEPAPFDPLPSKSPGMLPDGAKSFHTYAGILIDAPGHPHDLARLIEEVLTCVKIPVPDNVRRWLQRDFFTSHLQRYSRSHRRAPIYWPLATNSGSYTLWIYYPSLTSQTLYRAINDFLEPQIKQTGSDVLALRDKGPDQTRENEKQLETLQALEQELIDLRDIILKLAPTYKPDHDDGVEITAAPLWPLFRHKPWQNLLKDTWAKLEKGDYDWAHLAMNYWPQRVREKCKTDKSLAIAHGLEDLYIQSESTSKKTRRRKIKEEL